MKQIEVYSKNWCGYSQRAKDLLNRQGLEFTEIDVTVDRQREIEMRERSRRVTVPQIFIDGKHIGGFDDLAALHNKGGLNRQFSDENSDRVEKGQSSIH